MTIAYFDCFAGISGDMTLGALIDAGGERAVLDAAVEALRLGDEVKIDVRHESRGHAGGTRILVGIAERVERTVPELRDRKSTRLNSSHANISYAVFCLIKRTQK